MKWRIWLQALGVAAASGAVSATGHALAVEGPVKGSSIGITAGIGAIIGALGYLAQSPIQKDGK